VAAKIRAIAGRGNFEEKGNVQGKVCFYELRFNSLQGLDKMELSGESLKGRGKFILTFCQKIHYPQR